MYIEFRSNYSIIRGAYVYQWFFVLLKNIVNQIVNYLRKINITICNGTKKKKKKCTKISKNWQFIYIMLIMINNRRDYKVLTCALDRMIHFLRVFIALVKFAHAPHTSIIKYLHACNNNTIWILIAWLSAVRFR